MTHIDLLQQHDAGDDAVEWASQYPDFESAWDACHRPDWMIWLHDEGIITISDRDLRLFACDCVRYTPIGDGRTVWDLMTDERSRNAVEVAECYANGDATQDELYVAWDAAWVAWDAAWTAAWDAARAAAAAASRDAAWAAWAGAWAAWAASRAAASAAAVAAALAFQADLLRKRAGNPFRGGHEL